MRRDHVALVARRVPRPVGADSRGATLDLEFGGDTVATVAFDDGDTQNVHAGQGLSLGIGGYFRPIRNRTLRDRCADRIQVRDHGGQQRRHQHLAHGAQAEWHVYWFEQGWFVTAGITHHLSPELDGDGFFEDVPFDDATGFSAEVGWRWIALRYTNIEYTNDFIEDVDASSLGLSFSWRFGGSARY